MYGSLLLGPLRPYLLSSADSSQHPLSDPSDLPDRPIWSLNGKYSFDIKSAYSSLSVALVTLNHKAGRRFGLYRYCNVCISSYGSHSKSALESVLHVLCDCRYAQEVWRLLLPPGLHGPLLVANLRTGFIEHGSHELHPSQGLPWSMLFISTIWKLWNDLVFNDAPFNADILLQRSVLWARYTLRKSYYSTGAVSFFICSTWKLTELGWVCLTTDGAVSLRTSIGSVGGVFRADDGSWITGFNKTIGIVCPLQTELWEFFLALTCLGKWFSKGFSFNPIVRSD
ncbi:hypothetical protein V6N11_014342 [Hibiscus sabdariffa]|uniref:Reverse transcriptase zinc-binding domain-containing protein n=1 Tax=Hibiscus sabdariffa TaxID=183260 RepID=A0ABR1ZDF4_9ROSI